MMDHNILELLYRSFDTTLSAEEEHRLNEALQQSAELRQEKEQLISLRRSISDSEMGKFKPFFADRVLSKIEAEEQKAEPDVFFDSLFGLFRPVFITAAIFIIMIAGYNIGSTGKFSLEGLFGIPEISVSDVYDPTLALALED